MENRVRFLKEVTEAILTEWPPDRVGVRLSPNGNFILETAMDGRKGTQRAQRENSEEKAPPTEWVGA